MDSKQAWQPGAWPARRARRARSLLLRCLVCLVGLAAFALAAGLCVYMLYKGWDSFPALFGLTRDASAVLASVNGIAPALWGTLALGLLATGMGGLLGVLTGIHLAFHTSPGLLHQALNLAIRVLAGIPSIVFGLVTYTFVVYRLGLPRSLFVASVAISLMILPFVALRVQKACAEKGSSLLLQTRALGIGQGYALWHLVLGHCAPEIISALGLGMSFGMGAVAPILYTGAVMRAAAPSSVLDPFMSLPYSLYMIVNNGFDLRYAYGIACVLLLVLLALHLLTKLAGAVAARLAGR